MDNATVAPLCRAQRSRGGAEWEEDGGGERGEGGRPSIFDKESFFGQLLD